MKGLGMWSLVFSNEKLRSAVIKLAVVLVALCMAIVLMLSIKAHAFKDGVAAERARQEKQSALVKQQKENIENTANENWQEKQKEALNDEQQTNSSVGGARFERDSLLNSIDGAIKYVSKGSSSNSCNEQ